jgi:LPXTG-motif cell wall-anchored protein
MTVAHDDGDEIRRLRAQVAELSKPHRRLRSALAALLITVACVLSPLSIVASWTASIIGDTNRYVAMVGPLPANPDVQDAIASRTAQAVSQHLDVNTLIQQVAPADRPQLGTLLGKLSGPINSAIASFVQKQTKTVVSSSWFQTFWQEANRRLHATVDKALTGQGGGTVKLTNNAVVIDLAPVIDQVKQKLVGDGLTIAGKIPEIHTDFTVFSAQSIGKVKTGFRLLQVLGDWLPVIGVLLAAAGVWLSRRRRRATVAAAFGIAAGALVLGIGLSVFREVYLHKLPADVNEAAAKAVYDQLVLFLRTAVRSVVVLGVAVGLGVWLTGNGLRAAQVRRLGNAGIDATRGAAVSAGLRLGPVGGFVHRYRRWIDWVVLGAGALTLALWSYPTGWVVFWIVVVVLAALAVVRFLDQPSTEEGGPQAAAAG